jgi:hypothetical protein
MCFTVIVTAYNHTVFQIIIIIISSSSSMAVAAGSD